MAQLCGAHAAIGGGELSPWSFLINIDLEYGLEANRFTS